MQSCSAGLRARLPSGPASDAAAEIGAGGLAGALAWALVYPLDLLKCRMQARRLPLRAVLLQARAEGPLALFRGLRATLYRAFIVNAAIFYGHGAVLRALRSSTAAAPAADTRGTST